MNILAIDTSTSFPGFAVSANGNLVAAIVGDGKLQHSGTFFNYLHQCLAHARIELNSIDLFAAITGPGSYTGLRIGLAAISGVAQALGRSQVGATTLDVLALAQRQIGISLVIAESGNSQYVGGLREVTCDGLLLSHGVDFLGNQTEVLTHFSGCTNQQITTLTWPSLFPSTVSLASHLADSIPQLLQNAQCHRLTPFYLGHPDG